MSFVSSPESAFQCIASQLPFIVEAFADFFNRFFMKMEFGVSMTIDNSTLKSFFSLVIPPLSTERAFLDKSSDLD